MVIETPQETPSTVASRNDPSISSSKSAATASRNDPSGSSSNANGPRNNNAATTGVTVQTVTDNGKLNRAKTRAANHRMIDVQTLKQHVVVNGFDDVVGELMRQQIATLGCVQSKREWGSFRDDSSVDYIQVGQEETEEEALLGHDLSRITPKGFLKVEAARKALVGELTGLAKPGKDGHPAMETVNGYGPQYRMLKKNYYMAVMRKKTPTTFKARLVSRGDLISQDDVAFSSAPTSNRISIRMIICVATMFRIRIGNVDVTQAFLQSDTVACEDRQVVCVCRAM